MKCKKTKNHNEGIYGTNRAPIDALGRPRFGVYTYPFEDVNMISGRWTLGGFPLSKQGLPLPRQICRFRLKEWQHFALVWPEGLLGFAIVDAKYLVTSWIHMVKLSSTWQESKPGRSAIDTHVEHRRIAPPLSGVPGINQNYKIARSLWDDETFMKKSNYSISVQNKLSSGEHRVRLNVASQGCKPGLTADFKCLHDPDEIEPLVVVLPVDNNKSRGMYSHKVPLPVEGILTIGKDRFVLEPESAFALLDVHKAHYPRRTWWNWATFAGRDEGGRSVAINLTKNVNPYDDEWNENALWVDGELVRLSKAVFHFDAANPLDTWQIRDEGGLIDLSFHPFGERSENLNLGVLRSSFNQPFGVFKGRVKFKGDLLKIDSLPGVCENHLACW